MDDEWSALTKMALLEEVLTCEWCFCVAFDVDLTIASFHARVRSLTNTKKLRWSVLQFKHSIDKIVHSS